MYFAVIQTLNFIPMPKGLSNEDIDMHYSFKSNQLGCRNEFHKLGMFVSFHEIVVTKYGRK